MYSTETSGETVLPPKVQAGFFNTGLKRTAHTGYRLTAIPKMRRHGICSSGLICAENVIFFKTCFFIAMNRAVQYGLIRMDTPFCPVNGSHIRKTNKMFFNPLTKPVFVRGFLFCPALFSVAPSATGCTNGYSLRFNPQALLSPSAPEPGNPPALQYVRSFRRQVPAPHPPETHWRSSPE